MNRSKSHNTPHNTFTRRGGARPAVSPPVFRLYYERMEMPSHSETDRKEGPILEVYNKKKHSEVLISIANPIMN